jgi:hypothetical protein
MCRSPDTKSTCQGAKDIPPEDKDVPVERGDLPPEGNRYSSSRIDRHAMADPPRFAIADGRGDVCEKGRPWAAFLRTNAWRVGINRTIAIPPGSYATLLRCLSTRDFATSIASSRLG